MKPSIRLRVTLPLALLTAPAVWASTVTKCPIGQFAAYYVVVSEPVASATPIPPTPLFYNSPASNPPPFPQEPRRFDELIMSLNEPPVLYTVCSSDIPAFELAHGVQTGDSVKRRRNQPSELHYLLDTRGQFVGTVWRDQLPPFDQGGAIGGQSYWSCGPTGIPVVNNFAAFSSGLDPSGINGVDSSEKEEFYFAHIRERFVAVDQRRMTSAEGCAAFLNKEALFSAPNATELQIWFRNYDPSSGYTP